MFAGLTRAPLFAISTKRELLSEESWKWFLEAKSFYCGETRGGFGGQWPPVHGRRLTSEFLRGVGLGALRAILTQINQTAAVGPGRPGGLRPPKCESQKLGFVWFSSSTSSTWVTVKSWEDGRSKLGEWNPFCGSRALCNRRFFSFLRRVLCFVWKHWLSEIFVGKNNRREVRGETRKDTLWIVDCCWLNNSLEKTILTLFGNNPWVFGIYGGLKP